VRALGQRVVEWTARSRPTTSPVVDIGPRVLFVALLQKNVLNRQRSNTREQRRLAINTSIERTRHRRPLARLTPIETPGLAAVAAGPPHPTSPLDSGQSRNAVA